MVSTSHDVDNRLNNGKRKNAHFEEIGRAFLQVQIAQNAEVYRMVKLWNAGAFKVSI